MGKAATYPCHHEEVIIWDSTCQRKYPSSLSVGISPLTPAIVVAGDPAGPKPKKDSYASHHREGHDEPKGIPLVVVIDGHALQGVIRFQQSSFSLSEL
jgi:hypothetical protein